jgi:hypothetical protein
VLLAWKYVSVQLGPQVVGGGVAVLLAVCAILTSSNPSHSFNKHFSCDENSIVDRNRAQKDSSQQLTWLRLVMQQNLCGATINFWAYASQSFSNVAPAAMHHLLMHTTSCSCERNWSAWGNL